MRWVSEQRGEWGLCRSAMANVSPDTLRSVIATKYTTNFMAGPPGEGRIVSGTMIVPAY